MERCPSKTYTGRMMQGTYSSCNSHKHDYSDKPYCSMEQFPIGMAYVPWQSWQNIYEPCKAFSIGTIFAELDKPFLGMRGVKK